MGVTAWADGKTSCRKDRQTPKSTATLAQHGTADQTAWSEQHATAAAVQTSEPRRRSRSVYGLCCAL